MGEGGLVAGDEPRGCHVRMRADWLMLGQTKETEDGQQSPGLGRGWLLPQPQKEPPAVILTLDLQPPDCETVKFLGLSYWSVVVW